MEEYYSDLADKTHYLNDADQKCLKRAFWFAEKAHQGQFRRTGEPYISHPVSVAKYLAELQIDRDSLICALLHDVVEDTSYSLQDIETQFGPQAATIVFGLSRLEGYRFSSANKEQAANFSKMLLTMARDMRVILIKLADRMDNIKTIQIFHRKKQQRIALETLEIYAPIAAKIGLNTWGHILEDYAFKALYPKRYDALNKAIQSLKGDNKALVDETLEAIKQALKQNDIVFLEVSGREKQVYSIFHKMTLKKMRFQQLQDLFAFRIVVRDVDSCYRTLGVLHHLFRPVPRRFKDYIALPKPNGYQALHTGLINQKGVKAEVQIRSEAMHYNAERGIAANWIYKQNELVKNQNLIKQDWLNNLLNLYDEDADDIDLREYAKLDLAPKDIFVFTPQGKLITLPAGSTALDFAYAIHSKIGKHAISCEINSQRKRLNYRLENGEMIHIITSALSYPSPSWLDFVKTAKARQNIRNFLRQRKNEDSIILGKNLLQIALNKYHLSIESLPDQVLQTLLTEYQIEDLSQLFLQLGKGLRLPILVVNQLRSIMGVVENFSPDQKNQNPYANTLIISGVDNHAMQFARCCCPIHGDEIVGHMSLEKGLVIHRSLCSNLKNAYKDPTSWIATAWNPKEKICLTTRLKIEIDNGVGILAQLSALIADQGIDIIDIDVTRHINIVVVEVELSIESRDDLAALIRELRNTGNIQQVQRIMA